MPFARRPYHAYRPEITGSSEASRTLGKHLRHVRQSRKLSQKEAALILGVDADSVLNWEKGKIEPPVKSMPVILSFLGDYPFLAPQTLSECMLAMRRKRSWTIKEAAQQVGVDEGTWGTWERTGIVRMNQYRLILEAILKGQDCQTASNECCRQQSFS